MNLNLIPTIQLWRLQAEAPRNQIIRHEVAERTHFFRQLHEGPGIPYDTKRMQLHLDLGIPYWPEKQWVQVDESESVESPIKDLEELREISIDLLAS